MLKNNRAMAEQKEQYEKMLLPEYNHGKEAYLTSYKGYVLSTRFDGILKDIPSFEVRNDDVWVVAYPKSGITWTQEITYLVLNDADVEKASKTAIDERFTYLEYQPCLEPVTRKPSPRLIKSHLPFSLLPNQVHVKKPKFMKTVPFTGSYEDFCRLFVEGKVLYGAWWKHVNEAWEKKNENNVLILFYEDLHKDFKQQVWRIASFLEKQLTDQQVETIMEHCTFNNMKNNSMVNYEWLKKKNLANKDAVFMRQGKVGDWKNHLSEDTVRKLDEMIATKISPEMPLKDSLPVENLELSE